MRRKPGTLLPIEVSVLEVGLDLQGRGVEEFHGFLIAKEMKEKDGARMLTAHGTLYKALSRMQEAGLLDSRWEDPQVAEEESRPRRRLYHATAAGQMALTEVHPFQGKDARVTRETGRSMA
ncbi:MAG: PadR family transcriptional regulator [Chloroflexi bacterium]|nr:PadR family transcriptional regulator [Chloroflexota bacterium]